MAGNAERLDIHIAGRADGSLNRAVSRAQNALRGLAGGAFSLIGKAASVGFAAATAAVGAATTAVGAFVKSSIDAGRQFDSAMSQVAATLGTTVDQIGGLREFALEMGAKTAFTSTQAAEALNNMALAGYDAEKSMAMLPNVLNLAAAGGIDLDSASAMVTQSQNALGLTVEQTTTLVDQMAKTSSKSGTKVAELGEAILTVGGTAQFLAGGTAELNTVLGILADNGNLGAEGGTKLRNIILKLSAPTANAQKIMSDLGVSFFDAEGKMRNFAEFFPELQQAMSSMTDEQKVATLSELFNSRDVAAAQALLKTSKERWQALGGAIDDAAGAAGEMAATQIDNLEGDITLFNSALDNVRITLVDRLKPQLREFVQLGTEGLTAIRSSLLTGDFQGAMKAAGTYINNAIQAVAKALPDMIDAGTQLLESLIDGFLKDDTKLTSSVSKVVVKIGEAIIRIVPKLIVAGGKLLGGLVTGIIENLPKLKDGAVQAAQYLGDAIANAFKSGGIGPKVGAALAGILGGAFAFSKIKGMMGSFGGGGGGGLVGGITQTLFGAGGGLNIAATLQTIGAVGLIIGAIMGISTGLGWLANNVDGFKENLAAGAEIAAGIGEFVGNIIGGIAGGIMGTAAEVFSTHLPAIGQSLSDFAKAVKPFFDTVQGMDMSQMGVFAASLAQMLLIIAGNDVMTAMRGLFGGGDLSALAEQLTAFADKMGPVFDKLATFNQAGVDNAPKVFGSLAALNNLQFNSGGFLQALIGHLDLKGLAEQLGAFADAAVPAFNKLASVNDAGIEKTPRIFESFSRIGGYEFKSGGFAQLFSGNVDLGGIAEQLLTFSHSAVPAYNNLASVNEAGLEKTPKVFESLSRIGGYEFKANGVAQAFSGSVDLAGIGTQLSSFADTAGPAFNKLAGIDPAGADNAVKIFEALKKLDGYELKSGGVAQFFSGGLNLAGVGDQFAQFAAKVAGIGDISNFNTFVTTLKSFEVAIPSIDHGTNAFNNFKAALDGTIPVIDHAINAFRNFATAAVAACAQAVNAVRNCAAQIAGAFRNINLSASGRNMMQGLVNGILAMKAQVMNAAREVAQAASNAVNSALKVKSPSRVMIETGGYVAEGLAIGMQSGTGMVQNAAESGLAASVMQGTQGAGDDWIGKSLSNMQGGGSKTYTDNSTQPVQISYSPNYTFTGGAPNTQDLVEAERISQSEFERMANQWLRDMNRVGFKGALI